jgi:hypothetical protein
VDVADVGSQVVAATSIPSRALGQSSGANEQMVWSPLLVESHAQHVESHVEGSASQRLAQEGVTGVGSQGVVAATSILSPALGRSPDQKVQMVWTPLLVESHAGKAASQRQAQEDVAGVDSQGVAAPSVPSPALDRYPVGEVQMVWSPQHVVSHAEGGDLRVLGKKRRRGPGGLPHAKWQRLSLYSAAWQAGGSASGTAATRS